MKVFAETVGAPYYQREGKRCFDFFNLYYFHKFQQQTSIMEIRDQIMTNKAYLYQRSLFISDYFYYNCLKLGFLNSKIKKSVPVADPVKRMLIVLVFL